ncbi:MAG: GAF domain-containing sensor histidine kinase [bacterium]|nr:GAF domain-containing sensor histidine kinase [bacterium]
MSLFDTVQGEVEILYGASDKLAKAANPADVLDAVSDYARQQKANAGVLMFIESDASGHPTLQEVAAEWVNGGIEIGVGTRTSVVDHLKWLMVYEAPLFIEDVESDDRLHQGSRERMLRYAIHAAIIMPLWVNGRYIGMLNFSWPHSMTFSERDRRIYIALQQQASSVMDALRHTDQNRRRAARAEQLLKINTALSRATVETEILEAVAQYASRHDAYRLILDYVDSDGNALHGSAYTTIWQDGSAKKFEKDVHKPLPMDKFGIESLWQAHPDRVVFIENIETDTRLEQHYREAFMAASKTRSFIILPLHSSGRYHGVMTVSWAKPRNFTDEERHIYNALLQTLPAFVATRRAYLAGEEARYEAEFLYRASQAINAATTYAEIVDAVSRLELNSLDVVLATWEHYDLSRASYAEILAVSPRSWWKVGTIIPVARLPQVMDTSNKDFLAVEDLNALSEFDPVSAATLDSYHARSFAMVPLRLRDRYAAVLYFQSAEPRRYSERERRLMIGIGDLVMAAFERIRLQAETEAARRQAEMIAQANASLSQARDEQEILAAVAPLVEQYDATLSVLAYTDETRRLEIVALRSRDGSSPIPLEFLPITKFSLDDYPVLDLAYIYPDEALFVEDSVHDPRTSSDSMRTFIESVNWRATILIPLKSAEQWQGILVFVWNEPRPFSEELRSLIRSLGPTAASVVTSRRAFLAEKAARQEIEKRARELAALEERTRLARELHDSVSQALYGIGLGARTARTLLERDPSRLSEPLDYVLSLAEAGLTEMRALIFELRPESLEQEGLITVLTKQAASLQARHGIKVTTDFCSEPVLPIDVKEALYRIAREALHNTAKHSKASEVTLSLSERSNGYALEVADNGQGFDPNRGFPGHLGLKSMRERTDSLNGNIQIRSEPGQGTRILVTIPTPPPPEEAS